MRIGIVTGEYPPMQGGIGAYTHILAGQLSSQGADVFIFSSTQAQTVDTQIPVSNHTITWDVGSLRAIHRWASELSINIINVQFQTAAYGMSPWIHFLPHFTSIPVITTFHDLRHPYLFPKAGMLRDWVVMHLARRSAGVIVTNHEDYKRVTDIEHKVLIPIGSNIQQAVADDFDAGDWRVKAGSKADEFLIAYFGLFNQTKGLETLLASVAALHAHDVPVKLVMVGGGLGSGDPTNAMYLASLKAQIKHLGIEDFIHWTGYLEKESDVGAYLTASDVTALPFIDGASYRRGSLMAAIQYGCAIITTEPAIDVPRFQNGVNMLIVPPSNEKALTETLRQLWEVPELGERLKQGAIQLRQEFNWASIGQQTLSFFEQVRKR